METLTGTIERITFYNEENGYSVLKIIPQKHYPDAVARDGTVTVVGVMPELMEGEDARFTGEWIDDPRWGLQLKVETVVPLPPTSREGIIRYLSSGIVRGIGPRTAEKIVDHFGEDTIDVLDNEPMRVYELDVKTDLLDKLVQVWKQNRSERETIIFLQGYGISSKFASRIYGEYGDMTVSTVKADPYTLADDIFGIGFKKADEIARNMGLEMNSRERVRAGLHYTLKHLANDGHTYAPRDFLIEKASELLEVDNKSRIASVLDIQVVGKKLGHDKFVDSNGNTVDAIYLPMYLTSETRSADRLKEMANTPSKIINEMRDTKWNRYLKELSAQNNVSLTPEQQGAVKAALTSKISVLTGGPGTGKTTTLQMVIHALEEGNYKFALASPTGRAAKRLSEATGYGASTIHRLLGFGAEGFSHDEDSPLKIDMLIIDEASMIDLILLHHLLKALQNTTHLMLVGDIDQLPSVGAGNVLRDIIDSGIAYVTRLGQIFRQSDDSHIVLNAHRVNQGEMPFTDNQSSDFYFFGATDAASAGELAVDIVLNRLPEKFNVDPLRDVQVIAPMYRGAAGVDALNRALQKALNGQRRKAEKQLAGRLFRAGDKVMQTKNNYEKDVFNGDIGYINGIDFDDNTLEVIIDERYVYYDWSEADQLIHAYCISTHRSQGSEYPVVVMPILTQHYMMLQRNLIYTAITRARQVVVLVGDRRAIGMAVKNNKVAERFSGLVERLRI